MIDRLLKKLNDIQLCRTTGEIVLDRFT